MIELATARQIKNIDANSGIDSRELMQNAAECLFRRIETSKEKYMFSLENITVVCGNGNNGGDGYALSILLFESGYNVKVVACDRPSGSDALYYFSLCADMGIEIIYAEEEPEQALEAINCASFIIDAMFGVGLSREITEPYDELILAVNSGKGFVMSIDLPSGIFADKASFGVSQGTAMCVRADITCTFVMKKTAHVSYPSMPFCGDVFVEDIGIPYEAVQKEQFFMFQPDDSIVRQIFAPRDINTNKGDYGTLVMLCGSDNMTGAAYFAAQSAMRCGVGLEVCAAKPSTLSVLQNKMDFPVFLPLEVGQNGLYTEESLDFLINYPKASAMLVGCGLGRKYGAVGAVEYIVKNAKIPLILDADALNIISENRALLRNLVAPAVITPHPGEMARLCGCSVEYVQNNRVELAKKVACEYSVVVLLKGNATVIASPDQRVAINPSGSPAMAKGGMGDVLAGIIASLVAQGRDIFESAVCGAYIHGLAGELGEKIYSQYGLAPADMPELVCQIIKDKTSHII